MSSSLNKVFVVLAYLFLIWIPLHFASSQPLITSHSQAKKEHDPQALKTSPLSAPKIDSMQRAADEMAGLRGELVDPSVRGGSPAEQAVEFYSDGQLLSPSQLPMYGEGFLKLHQLRNNQWGTLELIDLIERGAKDLRQQYPWSERLQIGDLAGKDGGWLEGHASHQNGLDADLFYFRSDRLEYDPYIDDLDREEFVINGQVTDNFDLERNWAFIHYIITKGSVARIFIDQALKNAFCQYNRRQNTFDKNIEVLRKLRHWPNHANHFHVRLECPASSPRCRKQLPPPEGAGC